MALVLHIQPGPLPPGQSTIITSITGALRVVPAARIRPSPKQKASVSTTVLEPIFGRRVIGGEYEQQTLELFANWRLSISDGELGDDQLLAFEEEDDEVDDYIPKRRYAYPREHKLAAIEYFQTT
jgi:hypothetical protein